MNFISVLKGLEYVHEYAGVESDLCSIPKAITLFIALKMLEYYRLLLL